MIRPLAYYPLFGVALLALASSASAQTPAPYSISASTYLGSAATTDSVKGLRIQSNGVLVLAANLGGATPGGVTPLLLNGATASSGGVVMRLTPDGRTVLSITRIAALLVDLAIDEADNIFVAAGTGGLLKLNPTADFLHWARLAGTYIHRVDASWDGIAVAHQPGNVSDPDSAAGSGTTSVFDPAGTLIADFSGLQNTTDVCIDGVTQTVVQIGWRQTSAFDGTTTNPVQIAFLRGRDYQGNIKWTDYNWPSNSSDPDFLNRYTNNMADTRGMRCSMGRDGKLYGAFECAGGNHIFRYSPHDLAVSGSVVGGDRWHTFSNTKSEHKTFFGRYDPATGDCLLGQQLVNRLSSGKGNTIRMKGGEIRADELGQVYLGGTCASGLPIPFAPFYAPRTGETAFNPFGSGSYTGGAWFMVLKADFTRRLYTTRLSTGGTTHAVDGRALGGLPRAAWAGSTASPLHTVEPVQPASAGGPGEGFAAVLTDGLDHDGLAEFRTAHFSAEALGNPDAESTVWGDSADADGDGRNTLLEYYAATDPLVPDGFSSGSAALVSGEFKLRFRRAKIAPELTGTASASSDLSGWNLPGVSVRAIHDLGDAYLMEAGLPVAPGTDRLFLRLGVLKTEALPAAP